MICDWEYTIYQTRPNLYTHFFLQSILDLGISVYNLGFGVGYGLFRLYRDSLASLGVSVVLALIADNLLFPSSGFSLHIIHLFFYPSPFFSFP